MTDRWSNPSGSLGVDRFHVWPAGSDSYDHVQNAANWDMADSLIGIPSAGTWPPTTGIDGGIYREVKLLVNERQPIGAIVPWFRPSATIAIPTLWAVCDGSTLTSGQHAFPGIAGSVTLPDLRNKFILGADPNLAIGAGAVAVTDININTAAGAPGAQGAGGSNTIVQTTAQMPSHSHTFVGNALAAHAHTATFSGQPLGTHIHNAVDVVTQAIKYDTTFAGNGSKKGISDIAGVGGATAGYDVVVATAPSSAGTPGGTVSVSSISAGTPSGSISSSGSGSPMDNRPNWVGLIFICKVLYSTTP